MKEAADTSGAVTEGRVATLQNHATLSNITQHYSLQQYRKTGLLHSAKFYKSFVEFYNTIQSNTCHHSPSLWFYREFYNIIQSNSGRVAALQIQADFYNVQFVDSTIFKNLNLKESKCTGSHGFAQNHIFYPNIAMQYQYRRNAMPSHVMQCNIIQHCTM